MPKLTTKQAAQYLIERGLIANGRGGKHTPTARTVAWWCRQGKLNAEFIGDGSGGMWLIDVTDLDSFRPAYGRPPDPPLEIKDDPHPGICAAVGCELRTQYKSKRFCVKHERQWYRERKANEHGN